MSETSYTEIIQNETNRALWEVENVISCAPNELWDKCYCDMPLWKHIYHMQHSLDQWYINPRVYTQPPFHKKGLNNLDVQSEKRLSRKELLKIPACGQKHLVWSARFQMVVLACSFSPNDYKFYVMSKSRNPAT